MLHVAIAFVSWGEINKKTLSKLVKSRGRIVGDKNLTDDYVKTVTSFKSIDELSKAIVEDNFKFKDIPDVKPVFRLKPPKKGYEGIKKSFKNKGSLGYRGENINNLLERMM